MNSHEPHQNGDDDRRTDLNDFLASLPPPIPAELREWVMRQQATLEEMLAGLKDIQENGGIELGEVIERFKQKRFSRGTAP